MILDLHNHSIRSDDGKAKVENYCQWIRKRQLPIDGFVLTEHRQFDAESDYRALEDETGLLILKGSEVETDYGHVLVFGVNEDLQAALDFTRIDLPLADVLREADRCGAIAVPCHPGRATVGMCAHIETLGPVDGVAIVETLNGGSRSGENEAGAGVGRSPRLPWGRWQRRAHRQPHRALRDALRARDPLDGRSRRGAPRGRIRGGDMPVDVEKLKADWTGFEFDRVDFDVTAEELVEFASAVGERLPRYVDPEDADFQAVPNFTTKYHGRRMWPEAFPKLSSTSAGFDGGKAVEVLGPIRAGDRLTAKSHIHDIFEKTGRSGPMIFIIHRMEFSNQRDEPVSVVDWRFIQKPDAE